MHSASCVVAKAASGFHVFRIDGYSLTKTLPGGERASSNGFTVGGRCWGIDFYPNGADGSKDSSHSVSLYLRLEERYKKERVRAEYKFSLLDPAAGDAAYERPAETGIFTCLGDEGDGGEPEGPVCGYAEFISREELERRVVKDDRLTIRCDVTVTELKTKYLTDSSSSDESDSDSSGSSDSDESDSSDSDESSSESSDSDESHSSSSSDSDGSSSESSDSDESSSESSDSDESSSESSGSDNSDVSGRRAPNRSGQRRHREPDDGEFVRRCLAQRRRRA